MSNKIDENLFINMYNEILDTSIVKYINNNIKATEKYVQNEYPFVVFSPTIKLDVTYRNKIRITFDICILYQEIRIIIQIILILESITVVFQDYETIINMEVTTDKKVILRKILNINKLEDITNFFINLSPLIVNTYKKLTTSYIK